MLTTAYQTEEEPTGYPPGDAYLWQRIEAHTAHRWSPRTVVWVVEGPGEWSPPLAPAEVITVEVWRWGQWQTVTLEKAPMGYRLDGEGPYRITATVGADNEPPAAVLEAYQRLADYCDAEHFGAPGASSYSVNIGQTSESIRRHPAHMARALENSGAADLLRPYRRAG